MLMDGVDPDSATTPITIPDLEHLSPGTIPSDAFQNWTRTQMDIDHIELSLEDTHYREVGKELIIGMKRWIQIPEIIFKTRHRCTSNGQTENTSRHFMRDNVLEKIGAGRGTSSN
ncbi:unnamed protein product [Menidia menidia]|uniref:(Atlantic silverside) hypothetical protein n=1 Tax=Menidia menidia TaxID=238744 RepID=A0A8S4BR58_9TELE|nr:unnamed protein product [Menidia menidia]